MKILNIIYRRKATFWAYFLVFLVLTLLISCEDFVDIEVPKTELVGSAVFNDAQTAEAALIGIYSQMTESYGGFANSKTTLLAGLYADEFENYNTSTSQIEFFENALNPNNNDVLNLWREPYAYIYQSNSIIEGVRDAQDIAQINKNQLMGEAYFIRAFCHFYLVNYFGDIPYITTKNYLENAIAPRLPIPDIYNHIIDDLKMAISLLNESYPSNGHVRPNKYVAEALLARVFLYNKDWVNAEAMATRVIEASEYQLEPDVDRVFLTDSREAIWQLYPVINNLNTVEGFSFILNGVPNNVALRSESLGVFEDGDVRRSSWINSINSGLGAYYYPFKYKVKSNSTRTEYYMVLRLAEQYLIRAESRAHLDHVDGALEDINRIRNRAGLENESGASTEMVLAAVFKERQRELFAEWGHRWFDLKRTNMADEALSLLKEGWQSSDTLFPIPQSEIQNNPNMNQNPGY
ncbi:RagB/SusD family nutrient uptake outer membrane protein [Confluentibacter sediminis]|uniref:RagB/SusD family nutrient uptake outer membrane protein n=1 Tax=Confluentibacter sediminis TaxID=2219045 RepID=UPI000DAC262C|nr:RagB/SusD family nutrient uptake outer membrane protein [Confluentibacter sediminis]